jgi:hypothetical protein
MSQRSVWLNQSALYQSAHRLLRYVEVLRGMLQLKRTWLDCLEVVASVTLSARSPRVTLGYICSHR